MNADLLERARAAYRAGDYSTAALMFSSCKNATEVAGEVDHLRGNSLMKLGRAREAAEAYELALKDASYGKRGALLTNEGKALAAIGDHERAVQCFTQATQDSTYATPYKAQLGLGRSFLALDRVAEAGTAFRQAAIDGANPAPAAALAQLGDCFLKLSRPGDAIESYRTAIDFAGPLDDVRAINAGLGTAYAATNQPNEAMEAFQKATADGLYQLTDDQAEARNRAQDMLDAAAAQNAMGPTRQVDTLDNSVDPLDPLGKSGTLMPDPNDTGFFKLTEDEIIQEDKRQMKVRRKHRHTGLKIFIVILILVVIAVGGLAFAYTRGFGIPSQQSALTGLFDAVTNGEDTDSYLAPTLSEAAKEAIVSSIPNGATATITNMDQSMTESTALVTVELAMGGTPQYDVTFARSDNHIGWAVSSFELHYDDSEVSATETDDADADDQSDETDDSSSTDTDGTDDTSDNSSDDASDSTSDDSTDGN